MFHSLVDERKEMFGAFGVVIAVWEEEDPREERL